ncbi:MAG: cation:proton antiporter [Mycobacteriales bacterium]
MTALLLVFAVTLVVAVLISGYAQRSVLSTAVLFLAAGFLVGGGVGGLVHVGARDPLVATLASLALFSVLFTDGMHAGLAEMRSAWGLPGRALLLGMPLTFLGGTLLVHVLSPLDWTESALVGAVLTPTDPVFAAVIVGRTDVPRRLRQLLNVESGLNDGLALPVVLILLSVVAGEHRSTVVVLLELVLGIALGVVVPVVLLRLERTRFFGAAGRYQPLNAFAIGLLVLALCLATKANPYLAAFAAGSTVATVSPEARASFERFGGLLAELTMLAALLVFGALLTPDLLSATPGAGYLLAVLLLVLVRPVSVVLALLGSVLDRRETAAAAWFGPKGFASVTYGLLVLQSSARNAAPMFGLIAVTIALSILAHSSTDVVVARWFHDERDPATLWRRRVAARLSPRTSARPSSWRRWR